jgi:curved DNA-binding protein CbpA
MNKLAPQLHLHKNKLDNTTSEFQRIGHAWDTLKDPKSRAVYDVEWEVEALRQRKQQVVLKREEGKKQEAQRREDYCEQAFHHLINNLEVLQQARHEGFTSFLCDRY